MKKILSLLALIGCFSVAGCSCSNEEGVYVLESINIPVNGETQAYTCTQAEKDSSELVNNSCESFNDGKLRVKLEDDKLYYFPVDKEGNTLEGYEDSEGIEYKIEDGDLMIKEDDKFVIHGTYKNGKITLTRGLMEGASLVFKKK